MSFLIKKIPSSLGLLKATELHQEYEDLSLFYFSGKKGRPLFVSSMLHGNEPTGILVLQQMIKKYGDSKWPRPVYWLIGNLTAAREKRRHLDHQPDYNRVWKNGDLAQNKRACEILTFLKGLDLFASVDIHNNSGRNPLYSIVMQLDTKSVNLAALFSPLSMYYQEKVGALTENLTQICPSVTLEAGTPGDTQGVQRVCDFLERLFSLDALPEEPFNKLNLMLLNTVGTIKVIPEHSVGIGDEEEDIVFKEGFDCLNFNKLPSGSVFAKYRGDCRLSFLDQHGRDLGGEYFDYQNGQILVAKEFIPSMITQDKRILKSDCVCYVLKEMQL